jgi:hypothetical protein
MDGIQHTNQTGRGLPNLISQNGSLEFWSSGGLLQTVMSDDNDEQFEYFSGSVKHLTVTVLVEGQAAVAQYYQEASMKPANSAAVPNYRTRVTEVFVNENGSWRRTAAHYSPLMGGAGTSQTLAN